MKSRSWKNWLLCSVLCCAVLFCFVGLINFIVDPLWIYGNNGWWNSRRRGFDERQLKTNYLPHVINEIEGIVIGSSMSRYVTTKDFNGLNVYNYACAALYPDHAAEFILHAVSEKDSGLTVFIGLDLWNAVRDRGIDAYELPLFYIRESKQKFKNIFSINSLIWAFRSIMLTTTYRFYNEVGDYIFIENFPMMHIYRDLTGLNIEKVAEKEVLGHLGNYENYTASSLERLKEIITYLDIEPLFYITPVTKMYLIKMLEIGAYPAYEKFIRDSVNIFGSIWNFMYVNSVTASDKYFYDSSHTNSKGGRFIAQRISNGSDYPSDFGILVTKENLEGHIQFLRMNVFEALSAVF